MHNSPDVEITLSVITPVTRQANNLQNLSIWLGNISSKSIEVLLIHDKSDVDTGPKLKELLATIDNNNIFYFEGEYGSPGIARNQGLKHARGKWICFWDSDDLPMLEEVYLLIQTRMDLATDCIVTNYSSFNQQTGVRVINKLNKNFQAQIALNPGLWRFFFSKSSLGEIKFSDLMMAEDQIFLAEYLKNDLHLQISEYITYTYFKGNPNSLTSNKYALNDLSKASSRTLAIMNSVKEVNLFIIGIMFGRQVISGLKYGDLKCKIVVLSILARSLLFSRNAIRKQVIMGFFINVFKERYNENIQ
jgi:glycosyltransferase involved in cell wall biosynthesis